MHDLRQISGWWDFKKFGSVNIIIGGCAAAFIGYFNIVSVNLLLSVLGFAVLGFGPSVIVLQIFRLAGNTRNVSASVGISVVSGIGFPDFLIGTVLLGSISDWTSLVWTFEFLSLLISFALIITMFSLKKIYD